MFKEVGNSLPTVYANVSATNQRIVDFLKANGITDQEISIGAPKVQDLTTDRYNNQPPLQLRHHIGGDRKLR